MGCKFDLQGGSCSGAMLCNAVALPYAYIIAQGGWFVNSFLYEIVNIFYMTDVYSCI